jgi:hypothetical protein
MNNKWTWRKHLNSWLAVKEVEGPSADHPKVGEQIEVFRRDGSSQLKTVRKAQMIQGLDCYVLMYEVI